MHIFYEVTSHFPRINDLFIETQEKCLNFIGPYKAELTQGKTIKKKYNIFKIRYCHINWKNIDKLERSYELLIINLLINCISLCEHKKEVIGENTISFIDI